MPEIIYYEMADIAALMLDAQTGEPWRTERVRRWLQRKGACRKINGRWITTGSMLREAFPEIWHSLQTELE